MNKNIGWPRFTKKSTTFDQPNIRSEGIFHHFRTLSISDRRRKLFFIGANVGGAKDDRNECLSAKMKIN